jgi:hypothetical protein
MSKATLIKELTSQLINMNFVCTYHPKNDIHSDMFFDCQNSDEEPAKINLMLTVNINEKQKLLKYAHRISEYSILIIKIRFNDHNPSKPFISLSAMRPSQAKQNTSTSIPKRLLNFLKMSVKSMVIHLSETKFQT